MKTIIVTLISIIMLGSCSSDKSTDLVVQLPAQTQTGANTFGAIINEQINYGTPKQHRITIYWGSLVESHNFVKN